jgi:hypothetical protein
MLVFNCEIVISSSYYLITDEIFKAAKEIAKRRFGEDAVVIDDIRWTPSKSGLYFAHIFLYLRQPIGDYYPEYKAQQPAPQPKTSEKPAIKLKLKEVKEDAASTR